MLKNFLVKFFFVCEGKDGKCFFYIKCDDKLYMLIVNFYFKILGFVVFLFELNGLMVIFWMWLGVVME